MRLMTVELQSYKRFEQKTDIDVASDVVALVGPNEAGKSSILQAMLSIEHNSAFAIREKTRNGDGETLVQVAYVLNDTDRKAIDHIPGGKGVRWWTLTKQNPGNKIFSLHPAPPDRDLSHRHRQSRKLARFASTERLTDLAVIGGVEIAPMLSNALNALESEQENLDQAQLARIHRFGESLRAVPQVDDPTQERGVTPAFRDFAEQLAEYDEGPDPHTAAGQILVSRRPKFVLFNEADRKLLTTYELADEVADPAPALANLLKLAELNIDELHDAAEDRGRRETLVDAANTSLRATFAKSWRQSDVSVRLALQGTTLEVLVSIPGGGFSEIGERSAGLLSFVALRAFLAQHDADVPPVLLVDEAEMHLHYDAQADLIRLFTGQELAAKVIYTTHSAGCLPQDLGNGIRAVTPVPNSERSVVKKNMWEGGGSGFTPLIYGMGATTFSFLPARNVVLTEGITDAMLYPTLFREAMTLTTLDFQVAPGISSVASAHLFGLTAHGGRVVFITDGDGPGKKYRQTLQEHEIQSKSIFGLDDTFHGPAEIEDLLDVKLYVDAVNSVLADFQTTKARLEIEDLPEWGREAGVTKWCNRRNLKIPSKVSVVQRLLDEKSSQAKQGKDIQLLCKTKRSGLKRLGQKLTRQFAV